MFLEKLISSTGKDSVVDFFKGYFSNKLGQLSFLLKTKEKTNFDEIKKDLIEFIENNYYSQEDTSPEAAFENFLKELNKFLKTKSYKDINLLLFVIDKDNSINFSRKGEISAFLYQDKKIILLTKEEGDNFSDIVSGKLTGDSKLFFVTDNISKSLKKNIFDKDLFEKIKKENVNSSFGLVTLSLKKREISKEKISLSPKKIDKIDVFFEKSQQEETHPKVKNKKNLYGKLEKKLNKAENLKFISKFKNFSYFQKTLFVVYLILIIIFTQSLVILGRREVIRRREKKYFTIVHQIEEKKKKLKNFLIYNDKEKAKEIFYEIDILFNKLKPRTKKEKDSYNLIKAELREFSKNLYFQEFLENPELIVDLKNINPKIETTNIVEINGNLYTFDKKTNFIYRIEKGKVKGVNKRSIGVGYFRKMISLGNGNLIFVCNNYTLANFDLVQKKLSPLNLASNFSDLKVEDIATYADRIYILDSVNSQILKYSKTIDGFGKEIKWLEENIDLKNAISIAIDGAIYVLKKDGKVFKFYKGKKVNFDLEEIYPRLSSPTKIYTNADLNYLYILDPVNSRLVIFKKDGKLKKQVIISDLTNLKDFAIGKNEKIIWLLDNNRIYRISL